MTQAIATTCWRCGCRKSPPVAARRFWKATSATSLSPSVSGKSYSRRIPAQSGTVSMSNARTGVICGESVGEDAGRQVAIATVADDRNNDRIPHGGGHAQRNAHRPARGHAGEDALILCKAPRHFLRVGLADVLEPIDARLVVNLRQVSF